MGDNCQLRYITGEDAKLPANEISVNQSLILRLLPDFHL